MIPAGHVLELAGMTLVRAGQDLLAQPLDARMGPGECLVLMGPSGCGKSSLLLACAGALPAGLSAAGTVRLDGADLSGLPPEQRRLGMLFQDDLLFPHLSVGANLAFALPAEVRPRAERMTQVRAALAQAGLAGFEARDPATLSGGQRARAALMRTLLAQPRALLLDEPFSKLDPALRESFRRMVFDHAAARGLPVLLVTHDEADAPAGARLLRPFSAIHG